MNDRLGLLIVGAKGAVATTLIAAIAAKRTGAALDFPVPSDVVPEFGQLGLVRLEDIVVGGWDIASACYADSCRRHRVLPDPVIDDLGVAMDEFDVYPAVLLERQSAIGDLLATENAMRNGDRQISLPIKSGSILEQVASLGRDINDFRRKHGIERIVILNLSSTEKYTKKDPSLDSLEAFEAGLKTDSKFVTSGMVYAYAAIKQGCHFVNFTPSTTFDIPALVSFAEKQGVCVAGKDGKTGQTLYKTVLAPMFKHRALRLIGWYSANILGNRDGQVLNCVEHRESKILSKKVALPAIMGYDEFDHQVHIHYYPPRGDAKEAWDNIDFRGWFDVPMQMKVNWLGNDSVLAAPLAADLVRWTDYFARQGERGILHQLASYFKDPLGSEEHDFFEQVSMLKRYVLQRT